jgi:hypothetical protein
LKPFIQDPRPVLGILEKLKTDPSLMVRRSVANNINDIAKDNPDLVVKTLKHWSKIRDEGTQWLISHAARTLVKQGNKDVLEVLGFESKVEIAVSKIQLDQLVVRMGDDLGFSFEVKSTSMREQNLVIVHHPHVKAMADSPKVQTVKN